MYRAADGKYTLSNAIGRVEGAEKLRAGMVET